MLLAYRGNRVLGPWLSGRSEHHLLDPVLYLREMMILHLFLGYRRLFAKNQLHIVVLQVWSRLFAEIRLPVEEEGVAGVLIEGTHNGQPV